MSKEQTTEIPKGLPKEIMKMMEVEKRTKVERFDNLNQYAKKKQILFTGSSLMEHFPIEEFRMSMDIQQVIYNRGIGGTTTDDFLENIGTVLLDLEPSKVFINIGTNDIAERFNQDGKWLEHLINNYDNILNQLKEAQPGCQVYLMAYYPSNEEIISNSPWGNFRSLKRLNEANEAVEKLAKKYGYKFINVNEGLADENGSLKREFTSDGIHMIPTAYRIILQNMKPYIEEK